LQASPARRRRAHADAPLLPPPAALLQQPPQLLLDDPDIPGWQPSLPDDFSVDRLAEEVKSEMKARGRKGF